MTRPCISIIVATLDEAHLLERTLCSVLDQGYDQLELIVVDGGTDDETAELLSAYQDEIAAVERIHTRSLGNALNRGLTHATGDLVGILTGGSLYLPGALHAAAEAMTGPDGAQWVVGHSLRVDCDDRALGRMPAEAPRSVADFLMHNSGVLPMTASFYQRALLLAHGGFDSRLPAAVGYELTARLLTAGRRPTTIPQVVTAVREGVEVGDVAATLRRGLAYVTAAEQHAETLPTGERYALWRNCDERRRIYALAEAECKASEARRYLWHRLLRRPWWLADERYRRSLLHGHRHVASRPAA